MKTTFSHRMFKISKPEKLEHEYPKEQSDGHMRKEPSAGYKEPYLPRKWFRNSLTTQQRCRNQDADEPMWDNSTVDVVLAPEAVSSRDNMNDRPFFDQTAFYQKKLKGCTKCIA